MSERIGNRTVKISDGIGIISSAGIAGHKESEGPLGEYFDTTYADDMLGQSSWEKAESQLQKNAAQLALDKAKLSANDIDIILAGDLLNQYSVCVLWEYRILVNTELVQQWHKQ